MHEYSNINLVDICYADFCCYLYSSLGMQESLIGFTKISNMFDFFIMEQ